MRLNTASIRCRRDPFSGEVYTGIGFARGKEYEGATRGWTRIPRRGVLRAPLGQVHPDSETSGTPGYTRGGTDGDGYVSVMGGPVGQPFVLALQDRSVVVGQLPGDAVRVDCEFDESAYRQVPVEGDRCCARSGKRILGPV